MALWKEPTEKESFAEKSERSEPDLTAAAPVTPAAPVTAAQVPSPSPQRKGNGSSGYHESFFAAGVTIEGKIEGDGNVRIAGHFKGDINVKGDLKIDQGARIAGKISAGTVTIEGELEGNIVASAQVDLLKSGQIIGDLKAKTFTVAAGSRMRGNVEFGWDDVKGAKTETGKSYDKGGKEPSRANASAV